MSPRRAPRTDANQGAIVAALRKVGASVCIISGVGEGCPDLIVGRGSVNYLLEVKDGSKPPSARKLTDDEQKFHESWWGRVDVVESVDDALRAIGVTVK